MAKRHKNTYGRKDITDVLRVEMIKLIHIETERIAIDARSETDGEKEPEIERYLASKKRSEYCEIRLGFDGVRFRRMRLREVEIDHESIHSRKST